MAIITNDNEISITIDTDNIKIVETGIQGPAGPTGPQGPMGLPGDGFQQITTGPISVNAIAVIDAIEELELGHAVRWFLTVVDAAAGLCRTSDVSAVITSNGASHTHYAISGDRILYKIIVDYSTGLIELKLENLHTNQVMISVVRILIKK